MRRKMDKVVHFEIPTSNIERAKKFYSEIFGWKIKDFPEMNYTAVYTVDVDEEHMPKEKGVINGCMWMREKGDERPILVIDVSSIDKYLKNIEGKGGRVIMKKQAIGDMGCYSRFTDPEGNIMGIWEENKK